MYTSNDCIYEYQTQTVYYVCEPIAQEIFHFTQEKSFKSGTKFTILCHADNKVEIMVIFAFTDHEKELFRKVRSEEYRTLK